MSCDMWKGKSDDGQFEWYGKVIFREMTIKMYFVFQINITLSKYQNDLAKDYEYANGKSPELGPEPEFSRDPDI